MHPPAVAFSFSLCLLAALPAQKVGEPAPEIIWTATHNFGEIANKSLSELRGSVVLLEFLSVKQPMRREEVAKLSKLHADFVAEGLVVITIPIEGADEAARWVKSLEVTRPVAAATVTDWPTNVLPMMWMIDKDGTVLWRGHPSTIDRDRLNGPLSGAKPAIPLPGLEEAQAMRRAKDFGATWKRAKELLEGGQLSAAAQAQAKDWMQQYEKFVTDSLAAAEQAATAKDVYGQWAALQPVADYYQGVPGAEAGKTKFEALLAEPKNKREIEAGRKFAAGKAKEAAFDYDGAYAVWKEVATAFANTKVGKDAANLVKTYEKDGKLGYDRNCGYCKAGGTACPQHSKTKKKK